MTKLSFEQVKQLPNYKIARKLYYKKYPICVRFYSSTENRYDNFSSENWRRDLYRYGEITRWIKRNATFDYRTRHDCHLAVYLPDLDAFNLVWSRYRQEIETIEAPASEEHNDTMISDLSITVREKLFYNKYRYKVSSYLYRSQMDKWIELLELCESSFDENSYKLNPTLKNYIQNKMTEQEMQKLAPSSLFRMRRWIPYSGTATVYLKEYDDVCTLHLVFKDIITETSKIILTTEL